jgi:hypothetical protein
VPVSRRVREVGEATRISPATWLCVGTAISSAGSILNLVAFLDYTYERTRQPLPVGIAVLINFLPAVVIMPLLQRRPPVRDLRRRSAELAFAQCAIAASMAAAVVLAAPLWLLYVASGTMWLLSQVGRIWIVTMLRDHVAADRLRAANVTLQVASQAGAAVGSFGLFLRSHAPWPALFLLDAASFLVFGAMVLVALPRRVAAGQDDGDGHRPTSAGLLRRYPWLILLLPSGYITINVLNVAIPLTALDRVNGGQQWYAAASTVYPVSAIVLGWLLRRRGGLPLAAAIWLIALGWALFAVLGGTRAGLLVAVGVAAVGVLMSNAAGLHWAQMTVGSELSAVQYAASTYGAAVAAAAVLGVTAAFQVDLPWLAFTVLTIWFLAAGAAAAVLRRGA